MWRVLLQVSEIMITIQTDEVQSKLMQKFAKKKNMKASMKIPFNVKGVRISDLFYLESLLAIVAFLC